MITLPLKIRYGRPAPRKADAWLIPGSDCRAWLAELLRWEVPLAGIKLYAVPRSPADLAVQAVLAVVPEGSHPRVSSHCQPYARIGRKGKGNSAALSASLCLPIEARFDPDVNDAEILDLLGSEENVYLWHPSCGLVGFEPADQRNVSDLLEPPGKRETSWNLAAAGVCFNRRLMAIVPEWTPSAENVLAGGQEDIGSRSSALKELPRSPNEPAESLIARLAAAIKQKLTELAQKNQPAKEQPESDEGKQSAGASAATDQGSANGGPGNLTSVEYAMSNGPEEESSTASTDKKPSRSLSQLASGAIGTMAGMALAAGHGLAVMMRQMAKMGHWLGEQMRPPARVQGNPPPRPAPIDRKLLEKRHRETLRLMHLLDTDPDQGLKYALPFSKGGHRGAANPGSNLVYHDTDFNLGRLAGGQPVDLWDLPNFLREQMMAKYYALASRELHLGRCHRAAYIYAELLDNLDLAAAALKTGKHWREAAVLYRERLHRDDEAARCLEEGGLWTEAIALYEELKRFEKAGDLYRQLEQPENAQRAYRDAVKNCLAQHDYLAAARLLENKLAAPGEALSLLDTGWLLSIQAGACLEENFRLLARLGRHAAAAAKVEYLCGQSWPLPQDGLLIEILSKAATTYPDATVGRAAADATRTLIGARLRRATDGEKSRLLEALQRLVPGDRLLGRDCRRFLQPRLPATVSSPKQAAPVPRSVLMRSSDMRLEPIKTINLSEKVRWQTAVSAGNTFYAAGYEGKCLVVEQCFWNGTHRRLYAPDWETLTPSKPPIILVPEMQTPAALIVGTVGGPPLPQNYFPAADELQERVVVGTPSWIPTGTIAVERASSGAKHVVELQDSGFVLHLFDAHGRPLGSRHLPLHEMREGFPRPLPVIPLPLHARDEATYLAYLDRLVVVKPNRPLEIIELPDVIHSLKGSWPFSRTRLVATLEEGAVLHWLELDSRRASFATNLEFPVVRFIMGGWLVAASAAACQVYRTEGHRIRLEAEGAGGRVEPLAVLESAVPNQFALFGADGTVQVYEISRR